MPRYRGFILRAESRGPTSVGGPVGAGQVRAGAVGLRALVAAEEPRREVAADDGDRDQEQPLATATTATGGELGTLLAGLLEALLGVVQHTCHVHLPPRVNGGMPNVFYTTYKPWLQSELR